MSEAMQLLNSLNLDDYIDPKPTNDILNINANGRITNIPSTEILLGVETDHDVERKYFKCPKIVGDNVDLSKLSLRVHYKNANGDKDKYIVDDVQVVGDFVTFSWLLSDKVLAYKGNVLFTIVAVSVNGDGVLKKRWNTTLASGNVLEGLAVDDLYDYEEEEARDVLAQLLALLDTKTDESIAKVQNEAVTQMKNVENKGAEVLATIPADYTEMDRTVKQHADDLYDLNRTKASVITEEVSGEVIYVEDAAEQPPVSLQLFGKSTQRQTKGYQTFNGDMVNSANDDGSVTTTWNNTGVQDDTVGSNVNSNPIQILLECGDVFGEGGFVSFESDVSVGVDVSVQLFKGNQNWGTEIQHTITKGLNKIVLPTYNFVEGQESVALQIRRRSVSPAGTWTFTLSKFFVKAGQEEADYEIYTGMKPSPSHEYPQEIASMSNVGVYARGGNLIPYTYHDGTTKTMEGITYTVQKDGSVLVNGTATALSYFTFNATNQKKTLPNGWLSTSVGIGYGAKVQIQNDIYIDGEYITSIQTVNEMSSSREFYGNVQLGACRIKVNSGETVNNVVVYPILCSGKNVLDYEQSKPEGYIASEQILPGNPVDSLSETEANYIDASGNKYVGSYRDWARGVDVVNVKSGNLLDYFDKHCTQADNTGYSDTILRFDFGSALGSRINTPVLCNRFIYKYAHGSDNQSIIRAEEGVSTHSVNDVVSIFIDKSRLDTPDLIGFKAYLEANETIVQCILKNPIETAIPDAEMEAYRELLMNYPITTLYNSSNATMKLKYGVDTKKYVGTHGGGGGSTAITKDSITLTTSAWTASGSADTYVQTVSVKNVTNNTKIELQPTADQLATLINNGMSLFVVNENKVIKVYSVGGKPASDMTIQINKSEVVYV